LGFDFSDIISVLALVTAGVLGLLTYLYTRKTFMASHHPQLLIDLREFIQSGRGDVLYSLKNLSTSASISEIKVSISIAQPNGWRRLWRKRRFLYYKRDWGDISLRPLEREQDASDRVLEDFIAENLPTVLKQEEVLLPDGEKSTYYRVMQSSSLDMLFTVRYRPGISGAEINKLSGAYKLTPLYNEDQEKTFTRFEVQKF
jgi:hypothetical protein